MQMLLTLLATAGAALFAGAALYINVAEHPARLGLETRSAAAHWAPSYRRATWLQAPLALVSLCAGLAAASGRAPVGTRRASGDGRTPEGTYRLDYRNAASACHRALHISYPAARDFAAARASGVTPGGLVVLHGMQNHFGWIGRRHRLLDRTDGCIAVTDAEIESLRRIVPDGTPIVIEP